MIALWLHCLLRLLSFDGTAHQMITEYVAPEPPAWITRTQSWFNDGAISMLWFALRGRVISRRCSCGWTPGDGDLT